MLAGSGAEYDFLSVKDMQDQRNLPQKLVHDLESSMFLLLCKIHFL